jgi:hypothetical protein
VGAYQATPRDKSSTGTPQIWGPDLSSRSKAGKSYVVFGKKDNTNAIELSDIIRFPYIIFFDCVYTTTCISSVSTHNQII